MAVKLTEPCTLNRTVRPFCGNGSVDLVSWRTPSAAPICPTGLVGRVTVLEAGSEWRLKSTHPRQRGVWEGSVSAREFGGKNYFSVNKH